MPRNVLLNKANQKLGTPCGHECDPGSVFCFVRDNDYPLSATASLLVDGLDDSSSPELRDRASNAVRELCGIFQRTRMKDEELDKQKRIIGEQTVLIDFLKAINMNLSHDPSTGLLTGAAHTIILQRMYDLGLMDKYREQGYIMRFVCLDIDGLKLHNEEGTGGHDQGDAAIQAVGEKVASLFQRGSDITALDYLHTPNGQVDSMPEFSDESHMGSRSNEKGDEFVVYTFLSPDDSKRTLDTDATLERIRSAFEDLHYIYDGKRYDVTVTFAIGEWELPANMDELRGYTRLVDKAMVDYKLGRCKDFTDGIIVDFPSQIA